MTAVGIAPIRPYRMPAERDLPENRARWKPDAGRAVLLIHDMQAYFLAPFTPDRPPVVQLLANVRRLHAQCAALDVPVVYTAQPGDMTDAQRGLLKDFWGPGMTAAPEHRRMPDGLEPGKQDRVFTKWRYSALHGTDMVDHLREAGRDQLIICGVYAHLGCLLTACDAFSHDIQPFLVANAMADFCLADHLMALRFAAESCAVTTCTNRLLLGLQTHPDPDCPGFVDG